MMRLLSFIFILFVVVKMQGQTIQVFDTETELPIDRVLVYNNTKTHFLYTDKNGEANLSVFADTDIINFQHIAYIEKSIAKTELQEINNKVFLEDASEQIQEVVLSASRSKENRARIAEHIEVITLHKIERQSPQSSADLLALTPGVKVQKTQFGGGSPVLRGMESNRVLLVVDGVRMNNAIYRKGHLQNSITVSPNLLARTEVLFGPSSIIYGSDALGGVIHYYTKKPLLNETPLLNSSVLTRYSSVNNEITAGYTAEFSNKKWASLTSISVNRFEDLKMGKNRSHGFDEWGLVPFYSTNTSDYYEEDAVENSKKNIQRNTGYSQLDILQKFLIPLNSNTEINVNFQYSNSTDVSRFDKLNEYDDGNLKYAEWYYGPQKRLMISSQLSFEPDAKLMKDGQITLAYQNINESRNERKFGSLNKYFREENVKVVSLNGDFHVPVTPDGKRIISYGFESAYNKVSSDAIGQILTISGNDITGFENSFTIQSRYPDGGSSYSNFALYSNYRFDHSKQGTLNIGLRYTSTSLKAKWEDDTFVTLPDMEVSLNNSALSGIIGYAYKPTKQWQLNSVISSGFRSPNIDDVGKIREKKGDVSVPNTDLKPEYAYNAEIGVLRFNETKTTMIGLNAYYMLLKDYITRDYYTYQGQTQILYDSVPATTMANVNKGYAYVVGGTLSFQSKLSEHFKANSSVTYTKGKSYDTDEPLSSIPPLFGNLGIAYNYKKWQIGVDFRFNARKLPKDYNLKEGIDNFDESPIVNFEAENEVDRYYGSPAWQTVNLTTQYKLNKSTTFDIHIDNILDEHYKEFASGVSAGGRNISLAINAHF